MSVSFRTVSSLLLFFAVFSAADAAEKQQQLRRGATELLETAQMKMNGVEGDLKVLHAAGDDHNNIHLEAEDYDKSSTRVENLVRHWSGTSSKAIVEINDGDWIGFKNIDISQIHQFAAHVHTGTGGIIQVHLDSPHDESTIIGTLLVTYTTQVWQTQRAEITTDKEGGVHDVYFVFKAQLEDSKDDMFRLDWIELSSKPWTTVGNPIIQHIRTADPAAHVWPHDPDTIWLYASHDANNASGGYSSMDGYHVFSSQNLKDWTDHGEVLHSRDVSWGLSGWMWAPDACYRNGKYYFYFPHKLRLSGPLHWRIGIAVSDFPQGPFEDVGHYMEGTDGIDPACFQDDDGEYYLYFGDKQVAKLAENMVELAEESKSVDINYDGLMEGAWMHKRNGMYYYSFTTLKDFESSYAQNNIDETYNAIYSMGPTPYGPFEKLYALNQSPPGSQDHHSIVEFKGKNYYFYHKGGAGQVPWNRRTVCVDELEYQEDGTIVPIEMTQEGVVPIPDVQ